MDGDSTISEQQDATQLIGEGGSGVLAGAHRMGQFAQYEILGKLAQGGMGVVYRVRQPSVERDIALKVLLAGEHASAEEVRRFTQEAQATARLRHPYIIPVHEVGCHEGQHYYTMDFVEGRTLKEVIEHERLFWREALDVVEKVSRAIHYAHGEGILHRDLKPSNIMIDTHGEPRVFDFGLAKNLRSDQHHTRTGVSLGTPAYMAPEQVQGRARDLTPRVDVYALGAVLYEALTGRPPFRDENPVKVLEMVTRLDPPRPRTIEPGLPREVELICLKAMDKAPSRRYATARELAEDCRRALDGQHVLAQPLSLARRLGRWARRHPLTGGAAAVVALGAVAVAALEEQRRQVRALEVQGHTRAAGRELALARQELAARRLRAGHEALARSRERLTVARGLGADGMGTERVAASIEDCEADLLRSEVEDILAKAEVEGESPQQRLHLAFELADRARKDVLVKTLCAELAEPAAGDQEQKAVRRQLVSLIALGWIKDHRALPAIRALLEDPARHATRVAAVEALSWFGGDEAAWAIWELAWRLGPHWRREARGAILRAGRSLDPGGTSGGESQVGASRQALQALVEVERNGSDEALTRLDGLSERYPENARLRRARYQALLNLGLDVRQEAALGEGPKAEEAARAHFERALAGVEQDLHRRASDRETLMASACLLRELTVEERTASRRDERRRLALGRLDGVLHARAEDAEALLERGRLYFDLGDTEKAQQDLEQAARLAPGHPETFYHLGLAKQRQRDLVGAVEALEQAIRIAPRHGDAYGVLATCLSEQGDMQGGLRAFSKAMELGATSHPWLDRMRNMSPTETYFGRRMFASRTEHRQEILAIAAEIQGLRFEGNLKEALERYDRAIRRYGDSEPDLLKGRGSLLLELERYEDARRDFETVARDDRYDWDAQTGLVVAWLYLKEFTKAEKRLRWALHYMSQQAEPTNPSTFYYHLARALSAQGRADEAEQALVQAVKHGFDNRRKALMDPHLEALRAAGAMERVFGSGR